MRSEVLRRSIVVIEDSDEDYEVTAWAVREAGITNPFHRCATAGEIAALLGDSSVWSATLKKAPPLLVLLDLNLPGTDRHQPLRDLRADPYWQTVPVVIVSTSKHANDVSACYRLGAAGYLVKPLDLDGFAASMRRVVAYWFDTVLLPGMVGLSGVEH